MQNRTITKNLYAQVPNTQDVRYVYVPTGAVEGIGGEGRAILERTRLNAIGQRTSIFQRGTIETPITIR